MCSFRKTYWQYIHSMKETTRYSKAKRLLRRIAKRRMRQADKKMLLEVLA